MSSPDATPKTSGRRWWLALGLVLAATIAGAVFVLRPTDGGKPPETYCLSFSRPAAAVNRLRTAIEARPNSDEVGYMSAASRLTYSDSIARTAPSDVRSEALLVGRGIRKALRDGSTAPLNDKRFRHAVRTLDQRTTLDCPSSASPG